MARAAARRRAVRRARVQPLATLHVHMADVYPPTHWAIRGVPPAYDTPDEDVYLTGRNLVLLAKAGVWCAQQRIGRIVLGPLAGNPFPDATPEFFAAMARDARRSGSRTRSRSPRRFVRCTRRTSSGAGSSSACRSS